MGGEEAGAAAGTRRGGRRRLVVEADGGSRGNPGVAGYGALVRDDHTGQVLAELAAPLGTASNNVAEYSGLIAGLEAVLRIEPQAEIEVRMDSKLVVEQMAGRWKVRHEDMRRLALQAQELCRRIAAAGGSVSFAWVPRGQNAAADALSNQGMDGRTVERLRGGQQRAERAVVQSVCGESAGDVRAVGVRAAYDAVARAYDAQFRDELDAKPLDRALLDGFLELAGRGTIADVGCGPGHVTRFLASRHRDVIGIDLSPGMIELARERAPGLAFWVGSMLQLPVANAAWSGAVALYSIIHLPGEERAIAFGELARAVRPGGWLLVAFHIDGPGFPAGEVNHLTDWFGESVELDAFFLEPAVVTGDLEAAGFEITATVVRRPWPEVEYPSRRCYLFARRS